MMEALEEKYVKDILKYYLFLGFLKNPKILTGNDHTIGSKDEP